MLSYGKQSLDGTIFLYGPFLFERFLTVYATIWRTGGPMRTECTPCWLLRLRGVRGSGLGGFGDARCGGFGGCGEEAKNILYLKSKSA
jgi:hypothetical protein